MIDLSDPTLDERLRRRTAEGRYEISESALVTAIRALSTQQNHSGVQRLCEVLLYRCAPAFQRHTQGLRHRPELRDEAIANMAEHLLREVLNPDEVFMTQNFTHYLRCLCADEFNRTLRQEGLYYRRNEEGQPTGRPNRVPRALVDLLQPERQQDNEEAPPGSDVADPHDQFAEMHAEQESQRILTYIQDPMDRKIMVLRAIEGLKWDDIAIICQRTERTVRLRYERARSYLRDTLAREHHFMPYTNHAHS